MDTTTRHTANAVLMLAQRLQRWPNIEQVLEKCTMFERKSSRPANTTDLYNIYTMLVQRLRRWASIVKSHKKCSVYTGCQYKLGVSQFRHPHSNTVSLFASQRPSRGQG